MVRLWVILYLILVKPFFFNGVLRCINAYCIVILRTRLWSQSAWRVTSSCLMEQLWGRSKYSVNASIFFSHKIKNRSFPFYITANNLLPHTVSPSLGFLNSWPRCWGRDFDFAFERSLIQMPSKGLFHPEIIWFHDPWWISPVVWTDERATLLGKGEGTNLMSIYNKSGTLMYTSPPPT